MEENGLFLDAPEHWETWEGTIYIYYNIDNRRGRTAHVAVPANVVDHLKANHQQKVWIAVRHIEEPPPVLTMKPETPKTLKPLKRERYDKRVSIISICHFKDPCYYKHLKNNARHHTLKKALLVCTFNGTCNQKEILTTQEASRHHGIPKYA